MTTKHTDKTEMLTIAWEVLVATFIGLSVCFFALCS